MRWPSLLPCSQWHFFLIVSSRCVCLSEQGIGVQQNQEEAVSWWNRAVRANPNSAQQPTHRAVQTLTVDAWPHGAVQCSDSCLVGCSRTSSFSSNTTKAMLASSKALISSSRKRLSVSFTKCRIPSFERAVLSAIFFQAAVQC